MKLEHDDPRLIDYLLGELDEAEAKEVAEALKADENAAAREEAEMMRALVETTRRELEAEQPAQLVQKQRNNITFIAGKDQLLRRAWGTTPRLPAYLAAAAVIALLASLALPNAFQTLGGSGDRQYSMERGEIRDLMRAPALSRETASANKDDYTALSSRLDEVEFERREVDELRYGQEVASPEPPPPPPSSVASPRPEPKPEPKPEAKKELARVDVGSGLKNVEAGGAIRPRTPGIASGRMSTAQAGSAPQAALPPAEAQRQLESLGYLSDADGDGTVQDFYGHDQANQPAPGLPLQNSMAFRPASPPENEAQWQWQDGMQISKPADVVTPGPGTEKYATVPENPFTRVSAEPLSTFSIDVDTASYSNVRRFIEQGQLPPPASVRIEEMVNYFKYNYPQPEGEQPFSVNVDVASAPWAPQHRLARVALKGVEIPQAERPAANLVFLIDVSGSMDQPNKLPLVKESLKALLTTLRADDTVGIVTYAGSSGVALEPTPCGENVNAIRNVIDMLGAGGSTAGAAGIQDAYSLAKRNFDNNKINRVILATDGDFNVGMTDREQLIQFVRDQADSGVRLTVLGYGMGNIQDATLEQLADRGDGQYAYIDDFTEARRVLVDQVGGTLLTIAKDVKIQVEFNPAQVAAYRLIGYENRALNKEDFNDDRKDAGEIGSGHTVTALYELVPVGVPVQAGVDELKYQGTQEEAAAPVEPQAGSPELMTVKLRYKLPKASESTRVEHPVTDSGAGIEAANEDFRFAAAVAAFAMQLRGSQHDSAFTVEDVQRLAESGVANDMERRQFVDLVISAKTLMGR